jgi:hypothetical protein
MVKRGLKTVSQRSMEAGAKNLMVWKKEHPEGGNLRHGAHSGTIRKKYSDKRTTEGKQLASIMKGLRDDFGGNGNIPMAAQIILDSIKSKVVVILQIGKYVDRQIELIDQKTGELLPCLGRNFTSYTESLRRDLEALTAMTSKKPSRVPDLDTYLKQAYSEKGDDDKH